MVEGEAASIRPLGPAPPRLELELRKPQKREGLSGEGSVCRLGGRERPAALWASVEGQVGVEQEMMGETE